MSNPMDSFVLPLSSKNEPTLDTSKDVTRP